MCVERQRQEEGKKKDKGETVGRGGGDGEGEEKREERKGWEGGEGAEMVLKVETCSLRCKHLPAPNILLPKVCP